MEEAAVGNRKRKPSGFQTLKVACEALVKKIRVQAGELKYKQLTDISFWREFVSVDFHAQLPSYHYMGRKFTGSLIRFILKRDKSIYRTNRAASFIKYVSGTPGFGRTVSLNTAVIYLYLRSVKAMEEKQSGTTAMGSEAVAVVAHLAEHRDDEGKSIERVEGKQKKKKRENPDNFDISDHRFLLLSGEEFVKEPLDVLFTGLIMAYIKDPEALADLEAMDYSNEKEFSRYLQRRTERVIIILGDGNAVDVEERDTDAKKREKESAFNFLLSLRRRNVDVIICASARRKLRQLVLKESADYFLGAGGFSEDEVCKFISHLMIKEPVTVAHKIRKRTGWVPRLVAQYLTSRACFKDSYRVLENDLMKYIRAVENLYEMRWLLSAIAGEKIRPLSDALDTSCYYRGPGSMAKCLTPLLHSYAIAAVAETAQRTGYIAAKSRVSEFTVVIRKDDNVSRIGWNAEAATLLVLKLLKTSIPHVNVVVDPEEVLIFSGWLTRERILEAGRPRALFIPREFNYTGADVYYVTQDAVVVFQITVTVEYEKCHPKTEEVARKLFDRDNRMKVVVWIVVTDKSRCEEPSTTDNFYRVYIPFGEVNSSLGCIDMKVMQLRKGREQLCSRCKKPEGPGMQVMCDLCGSWFHTDCVVVENKDAAWYCCDCRVGLGEGEDEKTWKKKDMEEDSDYDPDYETSAR